MLPAPTPVPDPVAELQRPLQVTRARLRDVPRIAIGHTAAIAARRPRPLRWLLWPDVLTTALQLIGPTGRREVFCTGHGSSLVMSPVHPARTPTSAIIATALTYLLAVVLLPLTAATRATTISGPAGTIGLLAVAAYAAAITAAPLLIAGTRARPEPLAVPPSGVHGSVRLHDLVRHPRDPHGTGVALLTDVIHHPEFAATTITTTAATSHLADAYQAAGMTRQPDSLTLHRRPHARPVRSDL